MITHVGLYKGRNPYVLFCIVLMLFLAFQNSRKQFIYMSCQNVNRKQKDNDGPINKIIKCINQKHVYTNFEEEDDDIASARNDELLKKRVV